MHLAAENNHEQIVRILIENGADINATDVNGIKPAQLAKEYGNFNCSPPTEAS